MRPTPCKDARLYGAGIQAARQRELVRLEDVASVVAKLYSDGEGFPYIAKVMRERLTKMGYVYNRQVEHVYDPPRQPKQVAPIGAERKANPHNAEQKASAETRAKEAKLLYKIHRNQSEVARIMQVDKKSVRNYLKRETEQ